MSRILITGATGFTGRHACRLFAASGWDVVGVTSGLREPALATVTTATTVTCDLTRGDAVASLCADVRPDAVLHLAGQNAVDRSWREPGATLAANAMATVHLLEGMRSAGLGGRMLIVGSALTGGPLEQSAHPYAFSKAVQVLAALAWHRWYGAQTLAVEPSNLIGPGGGGGLCGKLARWAAAAEGRAEAREAAGGSWSPVRKGTEASPEEVPAGAAAFTLSSLDEERDYLDVRDAVEAYRLLLLRGEAGRVYSLGSGRMRTLGEVKAAFDAAARTRLQWRVDNRPSPSPAARDLSAMAALGWKPAIPFERSIADALEEERRRCQREAGGSGS
ncbi:NAD-dependent epimerase/dehydratase family protein [Cohnella fermenti]|uniref:NAD-dependent epimerase/dehydratase family protein n=2 Tax=Cohnella fermenti TaxID=2565925 RepID=A0A4S4BIG4_9BACL|nr:NAD-dependent epimerase/dehydratase family protein [Cohnella fermenti]